MSKLEISLKDFKEIEEGQFLIPVDGTFETDSFSDSLGLEEEGLWFCANYSLRESFFDDNEALEEWLRDFFYAETVYAIKGFIRKMLENNS